MTHAKKWLISAGLVLALAAALALLAYAGQPSLAQGDIIYVDAAATGGANDGTSWADAYTALQPALAAASSGDQIWVAAGTYKPDEGIAYTTCQEIAGAFPGSPDGDYLLNNAGHVFQVYCAGMDGSPLEYLTLWDADENYAQYTAGGASPGTDVRTNYSRVRLLPGTWQIDIADQTFSSSTGIIGEEPDAVTSMPYGVAMDCVDLSSAAGLARIDLRYTPFRVSDTFLMCGYVPGGSWTFSAQDQVVELTGGGYCGWVQPDPGCLTPPYNDAGGPQPILELDYLQAERRAAFQLKNGVALYGGFDPSAGDEAWEERDWEANATILSGDIGVEGDPADNAYHVFYHPAGTNLDGTAILDGFTITGGNANGTAPHNDGGGMLNDGSSPTLTNCTFTGNSAIYGGGMYNDDSSPVLTNCTFSGNSADDDGGGMHNNNSAPVLANCTFAGNSTQGSADNYGGGMYNQSSSPVLTNCTFVGNSGYLSGALFNGSGSSPTLTNCILWANSANEIYNYDPSSTPVVSYSDIEGGCEAGPHNICGDGNIAADPLFVDPGSGDLHLGPGSPCIDAGTNGAPHLPGHDFEGDYRILDGDSDRTATADMGVDERRISHYVDTDAGGANNGSTWEDAFTTLQPALDVATAGDEIWVAAGTYTPAVEHGGSGDRYRSFQLKNAVALYGGFDPSVGDIAWEDRDWEGNLAILSGDLNGDDGPYFANNDENSYHVFNHWDGPDLDGSAVLDGFTVSGGNANHPSDRPFQVGGAMNNVPSSPTLTNCTFSSNSSVAEGGGIYNWSSTPVLTNCTFEGNSASYGGGMNNTLSAPTLVDCLFSGNSAVSEGGGMNNFTTSSPSLSNCRFDGNSAGTNGGGMANVAGCSPTLLNCTFANNSAAADGGGLYNAGGSPTLTGCTFSGNSASAGGGIYNNNSSPALTDCAFSNNSAGTDGGGMLNASSSPNLTTCTFEGNSAANGGGLFNGASSPVLTNCTFSDNSATDGGGLYNTGSSPVLTNCTFWGNSADTAGGGIFNSYSSPELTNCILWADTPQEISDYNSSPFVYYSDIQGGYGWMGNIDAEPLFVDPGSGDFHLHACSPCIDAGDNAAQFLPAYDFEGDDRIVDGDGDGTARVDMGVDEVAIPGTCQQLYLPLVLRAY